MFKKIFKTVAAKLFNASKKETTAPKPMVYEVADPNPHRPTKLFYGGTFSNNPPGTKRKPHTMMETVDNQMTQITGRVMVPQKRSDRNEHYRKNGRFYHRPWPCKKVAA
jgi:hypothetical protein